MSKKVHFYHGCPWADGFIHSSDTTQVYTWQGVTCDHCLNNKQPNGHSSYWEPGDARRYHDTIYWEVQQEYPHVGPFAHDTRVRITRDALRDLGARVKVNNRQLKNRKKTYLRIRAQGDHNRFYSVLMPAIRQYWPDAYVTSGGFCEHLMDMSVALEK